MTTAGKRMAHDHQFIDDNFTVFAHAARQGRIARFPLEEGGGTRVVIDPKAFTAPWQELTLSERT